MSISWQIEVYSSSFFVLEVRPKFYGHHIQIPRDIYERILQTMFCWNSLGLLVQGSKESQEFTGCSHAYLFVSRFYVCID